MAKKKTKAMRTTITVAFNAFGVNSQRASYFLDIHKEGQGGAGAPTLAYRELPRGAVVFAVDALDTHLSEVSAAVMVCDLQAMFASADARGVLKQVQSDIPTLALEVTVLSSQSECIDRIRDAIVDHFQNRVSMHGSKAVSATAARVGARASDIWSALGSKGISDVQKTLAHWTGVRHQIVHQGKKLTVRRPNARNCIELIEQIAVVLNGFACK